MINYKEYIYLGIKPSSRHDKKKMALFRHAKTGRTKTIHFGAKGMSDYTKHHNSERKQRYLQRHQVRENWNDLMSAGALSRFVLWNKPTLHASIKDYERLLRKG